MRKCPGLSADARSDLIKASALINTVDRDFVLTKSKLFFFFPLSVPSAFLTSDWLLLILHTIIPNQ